MHASIKHSNNEISEIKKKGLPDIQDHETFFISK
jgi:hypothetical protein